MPTPTCCSQNKKYEKDTELIFYWVSIPLLEKPTNITGNEEPIEAFPQYIPQQ